MMENKLSNISRSKGNQTMKFGQSINTTCEIFFFKTHAENEARRLVPDIFFLFGGGGGWVGRRESSYPLKNKKMSVFGQKIDAIWANINHTYFNCT